MIDHDTPQRCSAILAVAAALALSLAAGTAAAQAAGTPTCAGSGDYYDSSSPEVVVCDDFDLRHRVVRSPAAYGAIWKPGFSALNTAHHRLAMDPFVLASGNLAVATLQWAARLGGRDGTVAGVRTFTSLAWPCIGEGWKIVREHNSSVVLPADQVDAVMAAARN